MKISRVRYQIPDIYLSYRDDTFLSYYGNKWTSLKRNATKSLKVLTDWLVLNNYYL